MKNEMKFSGVVTAISETKTGNGAKGDWQSVTVTVTEEVDKYPQSIAVECFNKQDEVAKISLGCNCDVLFNMEAKEYQGRVFGSNKLWKFDNVVGITQNTIASEPQPIRANNDDTGLPF